MEINKTPRGFSVGKFTDFYGHQCSLQKSSLATEDCIWLGIDDACPQIMASQAAQFGIKTDQKTGWIAYPIPADVHLSTRMHLSREQVAMLLPVMQKFVETGDIS